MMWNDIDIQGAEFGKENGMQFITLSDSEAARWVEVLKPVTDKYVSDMVGLGFSEAEQKAHLQFFKDRIAYWTQQQNDQGIPFPF